MRTASNGKWWRKIEEASISKMDMTCFRRIFTYSYIDFLLIEKMLLVAKYSMLCKILRDQIKQKKTFLFDLKYCHEATQPHVSLIKWFSVVFFLLIETENFISIPALLFTCFAFLLIIFNELLFLPIPNRNKILLN